MLRFLAVLTVCFMMARADAVACSTDKELSDEELFKTAAAVFVAHIIRTEEVIRPFGASGAPIPIVEGEFRLVETLKGAPPADRNVRDLVFGPGNCSLGLLVGLDYLLFVQDPEHRFVLWPTGSRAFANVQGTEPQKVLSRLRALSTAAK